MEKFLIDVSEHNGTINWDQVKGHIDGAIIRCGYGMDMTSQDDKQWSRNVAECDRLGIPYGVYIYSYATNTGKARSEAQHVLRLIKGHKLSYPVYYDLEDKSIEGAAVANANIFGDIIEAAGYWCGVYYNRDWHNRIIKGQLDRFTRWGAGYGTNNGQKQDNYKPGFGEDIWQYSSVGSVPGVSGNVDVNVCYRDFPAEIGGNTNHQASAPAPAPQKTESKINTIIRDGQIHSQNFAGTGINADGIYGPETKKAGIKVLQQAMNLDYKAGLAVDGIWGTKSEAALGSHTVRKGETQYMVTAAEILLMLKGYNPNGVESPGIFGSGLEVCVRQYQKDKGLSVDGIVGHNTFKSLIQ